MQLVEQIQGKLQKDSVSVLKMSNDTGISAYKIYKWLAGKGNPKAEDAETIRKWLTGNLDKVPNSNNGNGQQAASDFLTGAHVTLQDHLDMQNQRIEELKRDKELLYALLSSNLGSLREDQRIAIAYQKAWVDHAAELESGGDPGKKEEIKYRFGKHVDDILQGGTLSGIQTETGKQRKE